MHEGLTRSSSSLVAARGRLVEQELDVARRTPKSNTFSEELSQRLDGLPPGTTVGKLRAAFGDSSKEPRYIETVPRHGFRLVAPVKELPDADMPTGHQTDAGLFPPPSSAPSCSVW